MTGNPVAIRFPQWTVDTGEELLCLFQRRFMLRSSGSAPLRDEETGRSAWMKILVAGSSALICANNPFELSAGCFKILSFSFEADSSSRNTRINCRYWKCWSMNACVCVQG